MLVRIGDQELEMGSTYLTELRDSNDIKHDFVSLRKRMEEDGYILIRGFHDRDQVLRARSEMLQDLRGKGRLDPDSNIEEAKISSENKGIFWGGLNEDKPEFLKVVESPRVMDFFRGFLGGEAMTYSYKWARAIPYGESTGAHYDIVYMGRGTPNLYTLWTPFGDTPLELGTLSVLLGSHRWAKVKETYGKMDVDRDQIEGWFSKDPIEVVEKYGGQWATTSFQAGDAIFFGMYTMHASTVNVTSQMRISCDTRYQLVSEPIDKRWIGKQPKGHQPDLTKAHRSMQEARQEWGLK